jgi:hypothetical protein
VDACKKQQGKDSEKTVACKFLEMHFVKFKS